MEVQKQFGKKLKKLRLERKLSQEMLALDGDYILIVENIPLTIGEKKCIPPYRLKKRSGRSGIDEIFNKIVNAYIELPVYNAVSALNKINVITSSSGFHSHFSKKFNGLTPCWCIICEGVIPNKIKKIAKINGFILHERFPTKGKFFFPYTELYLSNKVASQKEIKLAKEHFDSFAKEILDFDFRIGNQHLIK